MNFHEYFLNSYKFWKNSVGKNLLKGCDFSGKIRKPYVSNPYIQSKLFAWSKQKQITKLWVFMALGSGFTEQGGALSRIAFFFFHCETFRFHQIPPSLINLKKKKCNLSLKNPIFFILEIMGVKNLWDILESCKQTLPLHHLQ